MKIEDFIIDELYYKDIINETFKLDGELYGVGISSQINCIVAVYTFNKAYNNRWEDGILKYIRNIEGSSYLHKQNSALFNASKSKTAIHVFEKPSGRYKYKGVFKIQGEPIKEIDKFKKIKTYCFSLKPESSDVIPETLESDDTAIQDDRMKLLKVYRTERDLVIETSNGNRYCRLSNASYLDIDALDNKCRELIGSDVITAAKWGYSDDYFFGEIRKDSDDDSESGLTATETDSKTQAFFQEREMNNAPARAPFPEEERSVRRIFGPPGTGKTQLLLDIVEQRLKEGLKPAEIAFVSFSNEAANVGKRRIIDNLPEYYPHDFINFRTLHSLSVSLGCSGGKKFMESNHMKNFDGTIETKEVWREMNVAETVTWRDEHFCLSLKSLANARKSTIDEVFEDAAAIETKTSNIHQIYRSFKFNNWHLTAPMNEKLKLAKEWLRLYEEYKSRNNLMDFDDMIEAMMQPNSDKSKMRFKLFIVDEAQDNSDALWDFAKLIIAESKESIVAGDDDQAIMQQFGASPTAFLDLEVTEEDKVLETSWRLPISGKEALDKGPGAKVSEIEGRKKKEFKVKKDAILGEIFSTIISLIDGVKTKESWNLHRLIKEVQDLSISGDWLIMAPTNDSVEHISKLFNEYEISHYRKNEPVTLKNEKRVSRSIRVQTIHTSKGTEAENVAIVLISRGDGFMYFKNGEESARLSYVAESRQKNRLYKIGFGIDYKAKKKSIKSH